MVSGGSVPRVDLTPLFAPRSVALIGASADPQSISARPLRLLRQHGYAGAIYPVNPRYRELQDLTVYPSIGAVPEQVDLALIVVPAPAVLGVLEECAAAGVAVAVVITSGFAESGPAGAQLQLDIARLVARTGLRVCGPNSEGLYNPSGGLCATFSPTVDPEQGFQPSPAGPIAVVSQSGGVAFALLNQAYDRGLSVGAVVSSGNEVDLGWADYVDYLLDEPTCRVVLGFVESFRQPRRLIDVARKSVQLKKPIVLAKIGRSEAGRRAAASHTASLVGSEMAYAAAFRQLGIVRVDDLDEMLDLAAYFSIGRLPAGRRVVVLTASGGAGAWLADACATRGLQLPPPTEADQAAIRAGIPAYGSVGNPVDITAQAVLSGGFLSALRRLSSSSAFDAVIAVDTLVREARFFESLPELTSVIQASTIPVVYHSYTRASPAALTGLADLGVPCFSTPGRTARALSAAVTFAEFVRDANTLPLFAATPTSWPPLNQPVSETGARVYLEPLGIASPEWRLAQSADEAVGAFEAFGGGPVALKVQSPDIPHKHAVGGVHLDCRSSIQVRSAFDAILAAVRTARPAARVEGVLVQRMAPAGWETVVAARREPMLGGLVVVGAGGLDAEAQGDVAVRLAPVSATEARAMIFELHAARGRPSKDIDTLAAAVVAVSGLAAGLPDGVSTLELNPLLVLPEGGGVLMLDAYVELQQEAGEG